MFISNTFDPVARGEACLVRALHGDERTASWVLADLSPEELAAARTYFSLPGWVPAAESDCHVIPSSDGDGEGDEIRVVWGAYRTPRGDGAVTVVTHKDRPTDPAERELLARARAKAARAWELRALRAKGDPAGDAGAPPAGGAE